MGLAEERCTVCRPGTPTLAADEADTLRRELAEAWTLGRNGHLTRRVDVADFGAALALAVRVGMLAEAEGHHPDLTVAWGLLGIELWTHAAGGLTRNDFVLAAKVDRIVVHP